MKSPVVMVLLLVPVPVPPPPLRGLYFALYFSPDLLPLSLRFVLNPPLILTLLVGLVA